MSKELIEELERMGADAAVMKQKLNEMCTEQEGILDEEVADSDEFTDQRLLVETLNKLYERIIDVDVLISLAISTC